MVLRSLLYEFVSLRGFFGFVGIEYNALLDLRRVYRDLFGLFLESDGYCEFLC